MNPCETFGCGYPSGECSGSCINVRLHRPVLMAVPKLAPAVIVPGHIEHRGEPPAPTAPLAVDILLPDDGPLTLAIHTYKTHRALGRRKAFSHAWHQLFRVPVQPVNQ